MTRLMLFCCFVFLLSACGDSAEKFANTEHSPEKRAVSAPQNPTSLIPYPDLTALSAEDRTRVENERGKLDQQIAAKGANLASAYGEMGMLYHAFQSLDAALACYQAAHEVDQNDVRWVYYQAAVHREKNFPQPASQAYRHVLTMNPDHVPSLVTLGLLLIESDQPDLGEELFNHAIKLRPNSAAAWLGKGRFELLKNRFQEAVGAFQQALTLDPSANAVHGYLAQAFQGLGDEPSALMHQSKTGPRLPGIVDPLLVAVRDMVKPHRQLREKSRQAAAAGDFEKARQYLEEAVALNQNDPLLQFNLGEVTRGLGRGDEAEAIFERVLRNNPDNSLEVKTLIHLATLRGAKGDLEPSYRYLKKAITLSPKDQTVNFYFADVARLTNHFDEALTAYETLITQVPQNYPLRMGRALCLIRLRQYPRAIEALRDDVRVSGGLFPFHHMLARVLATVPPSKGGNPAEALKIIRGLTKEGVDSSTAATMAMALAANGVWPEAVTWQRKAIELSRQDNFTNAEDLQAQLDAYKNGQRPNLPFPDHHPLYQQANYRNLN